MKRRLVHLLIVLALALAGISPACKFIGGASAATMMEICSAEGIRHVPAPGAADEAPADDHRVSSDLCQFCFNSSNLKHAGAADIMSVMPPLMNVSADAIFSSAGPASIPHGAYRPRGPPQIL